MERWTYPPSKMRKRYSVCMRREPQPLAISGILRRQSYPKVFAYEAMPRTSLSSGKGKMYRRTGRYIAQ